MNLNLTLGTQTFGSDTSQNESFKILDKCFENGIRSIDTAERYPFPEQEETFGETEKIIGSWIKKNHINSSDLFIGTKVTGRVDNGWKVFGSGRLKKSRIKEALYRSLERLKLDYVDVFYFHWPDRYTNIFGRVFYEPDIDPIFIKLEEQSEALFELKKEGVIKNIGMSNETPWGIMSFQNILSKMDSRINFLQNEFSFLNRDFERSCSEICLRENIKLISYSPLAFGLLTGKYLNDGNKKNDKRLFKHSKQSRRYNTLRKKEISAYYINFCKNENVDPIHTAIKYGLTKSFLQSVIIGVKNLSQLNHIINGNYVNLSKNKIDKIEKRIYKLLYEY